MCTLVVLRRPEHAWPLLVAGNRDELQGRPWEAPARHWPERPEVIAGRDALAGGSWFGINDHGVVAAVMNRHGTLGPAEDKRSRGELVLEALDHAEAEQAAQALADLDPRAYRGFNLFVGDPLSAWWIRSRGEEVSGMIEVSEIPAGLHMLTAGELNDDSVGRIRHYRPQFEAARAPNPEQDDWGDWPALMASRVYGAGEGPLAAMNIQLGDGFGTVCSQLVAIPRHPGFGVLPRFAFADGAPEALSYRPVGP
jgi:uncharacterized protein with NRDE domain